jgi:simple sugar transport system ATP-binding protein
MSAAEPVALQVRDVYKSFGHVQALRGANLTVRRGEIVGLVGDNGAGKSTLIKVLSGWHRADSGEVLTDDGPVRLTRTSDARRLGIETVYQDLALAPDLDVVANLFLGREPMATGLGGRFGVMRRRTMRRRARQILDEMGVALPSLDVPVSQLSGGQQQIIAVARALSWARLVVLMDEPTAALGVRQTEQVASLVRDTAACGVAVVIISHNLPELIELVDRMVVMRLGTDVAEIQGDEATTGALVTAMTGLAA